MWSGRRRIPWGRLGAHWCTLVFVFVLVFGRFCPRPILGQHHRFFPRTNCELISSRLFGTQTRSVSRNDFRRLEFLETTRDFQSLVLRLSLSGL